MFNIFGFFVRWWVSSQPVVWSLIFSLSGYDYPEVYFLFLVCVSVYVCRKEIIGWSRGVSYANVEVQMYA